MRTHSVPIKITGFTLVELIVLLLVIGIAAVFIAPRFADGDVFKRRGFYDETISVLRYAQKAAVAQRRNVCVTFSANGLSLRIATAAGPTIACTVANTRELAGPDGSSPYAISAAAGTYFTNTAGASVTPTNFFFNGLGQASLGQTFRVSGLVDNITIEQDTGYVHR